jgi:hypothetical protein
LERLKRFQFIKENYFDADKNDFELTILVKRSTVVYWRHKSQECDCVHEFEKTISAMLVCKGNGCLQCLKDPKLIPCCEKRSIAGCPKLMKIWDNTNDSH